MDKADTAWRVAVLMAPGRVGGVRLRPLSAWHLHAMQMTDTRFEFDSEMRGPTPGELSNAIAICRSRWTLRTVGVQSAGWWLIVWLFVRWAFIDWRKDAMALLIHVRRYRQTPQMENPPAGAKFAQIGAPPYLTRAIDVAMHLPSVSLEDAMNAPLVWLSCIRATMADVNGAATCAWAGVDGASGKAIEEGLQKAREAIERARIAAQEAAHGNA